MNAPADLLPAALARGLVLVDDPLLVARYREGLDAFGAPAPARSRFHVDALGYSPELADELGDPFYLGAAPLEARGIVVAASQLKAPIVHPGLGFAADAWRRVAAAGASEIAALTLREPLLVEVEPEGGPLATPRALADPAHFEVRLRTPARLVDGLRRLEAMKRELVESDQRWCEDDFLAEMAALAARVRDLPLPPEGFERSRHRLAPVFFSPAFGGSYLAEEPGASARAAVTCVLAGEAEPAAAEPDAARRSARGRRVELRRLTAEEALAVLERHGIARVDLAAWRARPAAQERLRHWIAVDACLARDPERTPPLLDAREVAALLREPAGLPAAIRERADAAQRLGVGAGGLDPGSLAPESRLRLAVPTTTRPEVRQFVRHLQAYLDPLDPLLAWCDAPDVFFARLPRLAAPRRAYLTAWLAANAPALQREREGEH